MKRLLVLMMIAFIVVSFGVAADIQVTKVSQDPDPVRAGDIVKIKIKLENTFEDTRYDMKVEFVPQYPFSLYSSEAVQNVGKLEGGSLGSDAIFVEWWVRVAPDAADGPNEFTLYVYPEDREWREEQLFTLDVKSEKIAVKPYIVSSDVVVPGKNGRVTIEIANAGANNVKALELELLPSEDYRLLSTSNYVYLGDLDIDDTESEDFSMYVPEGKTMVHMPVRLYYRVDEHEYEQDADLQLALLSTEEAQDLGLVEKNNTLWYVLLAVVIIVGIWLIRRARKKK